MVNKQPNRIIPRVRLSLHCARHRARCVYLKNNIYQSFIIRIYVYTIFAFICLCSWKTQLWGIIFIA